MSELPDDRWYTPQHQWAQEQDGLVVVGITAFAQDELGDLVYVELPKPGTQLTAGGLLGEVESAKTSSEVYSPVAGEVVDVNSEVEDAPELVNDDPYGAGWMVRLRAEPSSLAGLLSAADYQTLLEA